MYLLHILSLFAGLATALPTEEPSKLETPAANEVQITGIIFAGSGCPAGSSSATGPVPSDGTGLTLPMPTLVAQTGRNLTLLMRSNCQVNMRIIYPAGWHFKVAKAEYAGYARMPAGAAGMARALVYFSGETSQVVSNKTITGPYDGSYLLASRFDDLWSPCRGETLLNINSEVRMMSDASAEPAIMTLEPPKNVIPEWRRCSAVVTPVPEPSSTAKIPEASTP